MDLSYAIVNVEGKELLNHSKITKEDAFEVIKQNSLNIIKEYSKTEFSDKCYLPKNFDIIKTLLNKNNVYASPNNDFNHFNKEKFVGKFNIFSIKSGNTSGIIKDVEKFLSRGLAVYIYSYYIMEIDRYIDDELTVQEPWYWYRIGVKK